MKASETTTLAKVDIGALRTKGSIRSATLIAAMYVETRLTTLIARSLGLNYETRQGTFENLFGDMTLGSLVRLAKKAKMITSQEAKHLGRFVGLRNDLAHELETWDWLDPKTNDAMGAWCDFVIKFMEETDARKEEVRAEGSPTDQTGNWNDPKSVAEVREFNTNGPSSQGRNKSHSA